jgi:hypothetical protein
MPTPKASVVHARGGQFYATYFELHEILMKSHLARNHLVVVVYLNAVILLPGKEDVSLLNDISMNHGRGRLLSDPLLRS